MGKAKTAKLRGRPKGPGAPDPLVELGREDRPASRRRDGPRVRGPKGPPSMGATPILVEARRAAAALRPRGAPSVVVPPDRVACGLLCHPRPAPGTPLSRPAAKVVAGRVAPKEEVAPYALDTGPPAIGPGRSACVVAGRVEALRPALSGAAPTGEDPPTVGTPKMGPVGGGPGVAVREGKPMEWVRKALDAWPTDALGRKVSANVDANACPRGATPPSRPVKGQDKARPRDRLVRPTAPPALGPAR